MKCTYCENEIKKGTGTMYVLKTGDLKYFCSTRCYKNSIVMKRRFNKKENKKHKAK